MIKLGFGKMTDTSLRVTNTVAGFRHTLDIAAISEPFLHHYSAAARPPREGAQGDFDNFIALCTEVHERGVGYRVKLA